VHESGGHFEHSCLPVVPEGHKRVAGGAVAMRRNHRLPSSTSLRDDRMPYFGNGGNAHHFHSHPSEGAAALRRFRLIEEGI